MRHVWASQTLHVWKNLGELAEVLADRYHHVPRDHVGHSSKHRSFVGLRSSSGANPLGPPRPHAHVGSSSRRFCLGGVGGRSKPRLRSWTSFKGDCMGLHFHGPPKSHGFMDCVFFSGCRTPPRSPKKAPNGRRLVQPAFSSCRGKPVPGIRKAGSH